MTNMECRYRVYWPGGNTTALVQREFKRSEYAEVSKKILEADSSIEQVGFIEAPTKVGAQVRLHMMGGEFCGNAARSLAYWWHDVYGSDHVTMEVSGFDGLVEASVKADRVSIILPDIFFIKSTDKNGQYIIDLAGIRHVVVFDSKQYDIEVIKKEHSDALSVGLMMVTTVGEILKIDPFVCVMATGTCYHETACGSGSIATAVAARIYYGFPDDVVIEQPTGEKFTVSVKKNKNGEIVSVSLDGKVSYMGEKTIAW